MNRQLDALRADPSNRELFEKLAGKLRDAGDIEQLLEALELHVSAEKDASRSAKLISEALVEAMAQHAGRARILQRQLLELDPHKDEHVMDVVSKLSRAKLNTQAALLLEERITHLKGVTTRSLNDRLLRLHHSAARLWSDGLARIDRAAEHWLEIAKLDKTSFEPLREARRIYASIGDQDMLAKILAMEIERSKGEQHRTDRALLEYEVGRLLRDLGRTDEAISRLETATRLDPSLEDAMRELAELLAISEGESTRRQAGELYTRLAKNQLGKTNPRAATALLTKAEAFGKTDALVQLRADIYEALEEWGSLARVLEDQVLSGTARNELEILRKAKESYKKAQDVEGMLRIMAQIAKTNGPGSSYDDEYRAALAEHGKWQDLADHLEQGLPKLGHAPKQLGKELLELSIIYREHLNDRIKSALKLHEILSVDPTNQEAISLYADHFRERRDWRGLADLLEFAFDCAKDGGASKKDLIHLLEEIAEAAERRLGDYDRALRAWRKIQTINPNDEQAAKAIRRLSSRAEMWASLCGLLEQEAKHAPTAEGRLQALHRIAQTYKERHASLSKTISVYEQILQIAPRDTGVLKSILELYERDGNDRGVADITKRLIVLEEEAAAEEARRTGVTLTPNDWPVAKRVERLSSLRRLASICHDRLRDPAGTIFACRQILRVLPGDRKALERLEQALEDSGDLGGLKETLQTHVSCTTTPAEKARVLRKLANFATEHEDDASASHYWYELLQAAPNDIEAIDRLLPDYRAHNKFDEIAALLQRKANILQRNKDAEQQDLSPEEAEELAEILHLRLNRPEKAAEVWEHLADREDAEDEKRLQALKASCALLWQQENWLKTQQTLERVITLQLEMGQKKQAAESLTHLADIQANQLGSASDAIKTLSRVLVSADPTHREAHSLLRELHLKANQYDKAVRIAEKELLLTSDFDQQIELLEHIGRLCNDSLKDEARAKLAYQRILGLDENHENALAEVSALHAKTQDWEKFIETSEKRLDKVDDSEAEFAILNRLAQIEVEQMKRPRNSMQFLARALKVKHDSRLIDHLYEVAEQSHLWRDLDGIYGDVRVRLKAAGPQVESEYRKLTYSVAQIREQKLSNPEGAFDVLKELLDLNSASFETLNDLVRLAEDHNSKAMWQTTAEQFERFSHRPLPQRRELLMKLSSIYEDKLLDKDKAFQPLLTAFSWQPYDSDVQTAIYRLSERTDNWEQVISMETALVLLENDATARVAHLKRRAEVLEERMNQPIRAFRTMISAKLLTPQDDEVAATLWRLAEQIGEYPSGSKFPADEPKPALVREVKATPPATPDAPSRKARVIDSSPIYIEASGPPREETEELSMTDLELMAGVGAAMPKKRASTMPLSLDDIETLDVELEEIGQVPVKRSTVPLPTVPKRSYESAWEELIEATLLGKSSDEEALLKASQIWEEGARDPEKAMTVIRDGLLEAGTRMPQLQSRLHNLAKEHKQWTKLADIYKEAADNARDKESGIEYLLDVAGILNNSDQAAECERLCRRVLGIDPDQQNARAQLEALYRKQKRWVDLAAMIEERTDPRLGKLAPADELPGLLEELADIYESKLSRPHDAIEAISRRIEYVPDDENAYRHLIKIFTSLHQWHDVIRVLRSLSDLEVNSDTSREALLEIARIYREDLMQPGKAIAVYVEISSFWPDCQVAYEQLDALYQQTGNWNELSNILRRRAGLTQDKSARAKLLQRRAEVLLNHLDDPSEAAAALRLAKSVDNENHAIISMFVEALCRSNKAREAAATLNEQIETLKPTDSKGNIAGLLIRLATIRAEYLDDTEGARDAVDEALQLVPEHPTALATLAKITNKDSEPIAFAQTKMREAEAATDMDTKISAYRDAGESLKDAGKNEQAKQCFEKILNMRPYDAEASWALAAIVETAGNQEEAISLLQKQLENSSLPKEARVETHMRLAAIAREIDITNVANQHLQEACNLVPTSPKPLFALADLLAESKEFSQLESVLTSKKDYFEEADSGIKAEILRRMALSLEGQDKSDDAYHALLEAETLDRKNVLVRIALGLNRYRAKRWRESALHLSSVAENPRAEEYPTEASAALWTAAQAEIRAKRPERAKALYERAIEIKPDYGPALHSLAEISIDQGEYRRAVELLAMEADSSDDPNVKLQSYSALGDLAVLRLDDPKSAADYYHRAVTCGVNLNAEHLQLLNKLLEQQKVIQDLEGQAQTLELLASFQSRDQSVDTLVTSAKLYRDAGNSEKALAVAKRATQEDPYAVNSAILYSRLALALNQSSDVAALLGRIAGSGLETLEKAGAEKRAELHLLLGQARSLRGDTAGGRTAFESAIAEAPQSQHAMEARRMLIRDQAWREETDEDTVLETLSLIANFSKAVHDVLDLAKYLEGTDRHAEGVTAYRVADALGHDLDIHQTAYVNRYRRKTLSPGESYGGRLPKQWSERALVAEPDTGLAPILETLWEARRAIWPDPNEALAQSNLAGQVSRLAAESKLGQMFPRLTTALSSERTILYKTEVEDAEQIKLICATTPVVIFRHDFVAAQSDEENDTWMRFELGRVAELTRPERIVALGQRPEQFMTFVAGIVAAFGTDEQKEALCTDDSIARGEAIRSSLPVKARSTISDLLRFTELDLLRPADYIESSLAAADKAGMVLCGSIDVALRAVRDDPDRGKERHRAILSFALSPDYEATRKRLGLTV